MLAYSISWNPFLHFSDETNLAHSIILFGSVLHPLVLVFLFSFLFFLDFIYLFERKRERAGAGRRGRGIGRSRLLTEQEAQCGAGFQDPGIMT